MYPYIHFLGRNFPTYGIMAAIGLVVTCLFVEKQSVKHGMHSGEMLETMIPVVIGVLVGSHLLYALVSLPDVSRIGVLGLFQGAVFYGGLYGGLLCGYLWVKWRHYNMNAALDTMAVATPLFHAIARIGCFLAGCCYGIESRFGFVMTRSVAYGANGVRRFPVQLLESALEFILAAVLYNAFYKKGKKQGRLMSYYLGTYAIIRFLDEFLRGDTYRGVFGPFSTSQWIALITLAVLAVRYFRRGRLRPQEEGGEEETETPMEAVPAGSGPQAVSSNKVLQEGEKE